MDKTSIICPGALHGDCAAEIDETGVEFASASVVPFSVLSGTGQKAFYQSSRARPATTRHPDKFA